MIGWRNNINVNYEGKNLFYSIYEPRLYIERILKKWEESSHKDFIQEEVKKLKDEIKAEKMDVDK